MCCTSEMLSRTPVLLQPTFLPIFLLHQVQTNSLSLVIQYLLWSQDHHPEHIPLLYKIRVPGDLSLQVLENVLKFFKFSLRFAFFHRSQMHCIKAQLDDRNHMIIGTGKV